MVWPPLPGVFDDSGYCLIDSLGVGVFVNDGDDRLQYFRKECLHKLHTSNEVKRDISIVIVLLFSNL